jgi:predicted site-specific integrase-resolvase
MKEKSRASARRQGSASSMSGGWEGIELQLPLFATAVSASAKQRDDLARQVHFMRERHPEAEIIEDIGSGLNFKRKGLQALLVRFMRGDKLTLVVACRDRLCRFGFELFEFMAERNGGRVVVLSEPAHCPESELTADLLAILHVFSCRMHGLRRYRKEIKEDPSIPKL